MLEFGSRMARARWFASMAVICMTVALLGGCGGGGGVAVSPPGGGSNVPRAAPTGKGLNYATGNGMDQLNCDSTDTTQIANDMAQVVGAGAGWVRVEASESAVSGLPASPACDARALQADPYSGIRNLVAGVRTAGAQPLVDILAYRYDTASRATYLKWLDGLLAALPDAPAFELGNEPNLANSTEGWTNGGNPFPYGWTFNAADFSSSDATGACPTDPVAAADLSAAVSSYVAWLADSYREIKSQRPGATVVLGGLSSWQPQCFMQLLDQDGAASNVDAVAYHPYAPAPQQAVATLDLVWPVLQKWGKPVWITEFGYSSTGSSTNDAVTEAVKAKYLADTYTQLTSRLSGANLLGPILYYTARDEASTTAQWAAQCQYVTCQASAGTGDRAQIAGTALDVGGYGLFDWLDGQLIVEPAFTAFASLR